MHALLIRVDFALATLLLVVAPLGLLAALHPSLDPAVLGDVATGGLVVYGVYLGASLVRTTRRLGAGASDD